MKGYRYVTMQPTTTKLGEVPPQMPLISYGSTKGYCKENRRVLEENDNVLE
jgi:hypothetical protein